VKYANWVLAVKAWARKNKEEPQNVRVPFKTAMEKQDDELDKILSKYTTIPRRLNELPGSN